jgi:hypothetical protein
MPRQHDSIFENVMDTVTHKPMPLLTSFGVPVAGAHRIETQLLDSRKIRVIVADWRAPKPVTYWPVLDPDLASAFSQVTDERSLQEFNGRYGLLGYDRQRPAAILHRKDAWGGDPVPWALAHAGVTSGILGAVDVINDVRSHKVELNDRTISALLRALLNQFGKMGLEPIFEDDPRRFAGFRWKPPEALVDSRGFILRKKFSSFWANDPIGTAYYVLSWILNQYIRDVRFEFVSLDYEKRFFGMPESGPPRFGLQIRWDTLLQVIYWKLAESVGGAFRQCPRCRRIFPMDTGKDLYCKKRCGDAARSKKYRERRKRNGTRRAGIS